MSVITREISQKHVICPIVPIHNNLIIKTKEADKQTKSGIVLIESDTRKVQQGIVVALAAHKDLEVFKIGDEILMSEHAGTKIELNKEIYIVLSFEEVLGIIKGV